MLFITTVLSSPKTLTPSPRYLWTTSITNNILTGNIAIKDFKSHFFVKIFKKHRYLCRNVPTKIFSIPTEKKILQVICLFIIISFYCNIACQNRSCDASLRVSKNILVIRTFTNQSLCQNQPFTLLTSIYDGYGKMAPNRRAPQ
jgi:hypothetical protein